MWRKLYIAVEFVYIIQIDNDIIILCDADLKLINRIKLVLGFEFQFTLCWNAQPANGLLARTNVLFNIILINN